ncbi:hypothetical protein CTI12_AA368800 [Artemisia annua]|uniref:Homologous recombination OB-fold protein OB-fold domain-containing protein n=1 Tax=Artemisia annua TaxID=35608 RepID=A0A2U1MKS5_ARTAN|nr:hypothetical protein CTI12_AA368800 [Artemisia annua]
MNSPPNWEELLDIDDSDLRLSATTQNMVSYENQVGNSDLRLSATTQNIFSYENPKVENCDKMPVGIIRGHAGLVQTTNIRKTTDIQEVVNDEMPVGITQEYIRKVVHDVGEDSDFNSGPWIRAVEYMKSDGGTIHHKVVNDERFENKMVVGAVLILHNVSVFSPKQSGNHYLNITLRNVVEVFSDDMVPLEV